MVTGGNVNNTYTLGLNFNLIISRHNLSHVTGWEVKTLSCFQYRKAVGKLFPKTFFKTERLLHMPRNGNDIPAMTSFCKIILLYLRFIIGNNILCFFLFAITFLSASQIQVFKRYKYFQLSLDIVRHLSRRESYSNTVCLCWQTLSENRSYVQ